jgi:hypothetical protein
MRPREEGAGMDGPRGGWDPQADEAGTSDLLRGTAERTIVDQGSGAA